MQYTNRTYFVEEYNAAWAQQFEAERALLATLLGNGLDIQHIGSTSVPGLAGKPTLDILVVVEAIAMVEGFKNALESAGYKDLGEYVKPGARLFVKESNNIRLVNVHFFESSDVHVHEMLAVRDYLRNSLEEVRRYSAFKKELFQKYTHDYAAYRKEKDVYMKALQARAVENK